MPPLEACVKLDPNAFNGHYELGRALYWQGKSAEAVPQFEAALRIDPNSAQAHNDLGMALTALGDEKRAEAEYEAARRIEAAAQESLKGKPRGAGRPRCSTSFSLCPMHKLKLGRAGQSHFTRQSLGDYRVFRPAIPVSAHTPSSSGRSRGARNERSSPMSNSVCMIVASRFWMRPAPTAVGWRRGSTGR